MTQGNIITTDYDDEDVDRKPKRVIVIRDDEDSEIEREPKK